MASVFTFDPDPPRVSSPWLIPARSEPKVPHGSEDGEIRLPSSPHSLAVTRLEAEPQDGPTEYKLHLLLRPRRSFVRSSTSTRVASAAYQSRAEQSATPPGGQDTPTRTLPLAYSTHSRQHRLEQLTTQLLWRLQQSSPYHASSATNLVLPSLPQATPELKPPARPAKLIQGLEESNGALYEIGVTDDGTLVGLAEDEMEESLNNLRAMAASLGCSVEVLRMVEVGDCEWLDDLGGDGAEQVAGSSKLFVAEAYVKPDLRYMEGKSSSSRAAVSSGGLEADTSSPGLTTSDRGAQEQLRITLTGATTSGKSSLLGTLSTSTLDNARGKSRLSLLKHRHEIVSGLTSSVVQELIGYSKETSLTTEAGPSKHEGSLHHENSFFGEPSGFDMTDAPSVSDDYDHVVNYASENVSSWSDVHLATNSGRLVLISDSAGHLRYRRTTVRGLVGWEPHWTVLCISANSGSFSEAHTPNRESDLDGPNFAGENAHLSMAHLELCLRLDLRLVVVLTKLDTATKGSLREILSTILTVLKNAGRVPAMVHNDNHAVAEGDLQSISAKDLADVRKVLGQFDDDGLRCVPILLTSAVRGTGIGKLHALLSSLPIPGPTSKSVWFEEGEVKTLCRPKINNKLTSSIADSHPARVLFNIEDIYQFPNRKNSSSDLNAFGNGIILSGLLSSGRIAINDTLLLGPLSSSTSSGSGRNSNTSPSTSTPQPATSQPRDANGKAEPSPFLSPRSFNDAFERATSSGKLRVLPSEQEWRRVKVTSVRNMRLPVRMLLEDQVGTLGVIPVSEDDKGVVTDDLHARKGMVLVAALNGSQTASHTVTATFAGSDADAVVVGSLVVLYCGSVRASAKVIAAELQQQTPQHSAAAEDDDGFDFAFHDLELSDAEEKDTRYTSENIAVTFRFVAYREYIEVGSKVLVMPGGPVGLHAATERGARNVGGLDGFVGQVIEVFG